MFKMTVSEKFTLGSRSILFFDWTKIRIIHLINVALIVLISPIVCTVRAQVVGMETPTLQQLLIGCITVMWLAQVRIDASLIESWALNAIVKLVEGSAERHRTTGDHMNYGVIDHLVVVEADQGHTL